MPGQLATQGHPDDPVFPRVTMRSLNAYLKVTAAAQGIDPHIVSSHGLRRGGAIAFYAATQDELALCWFGRWAPGSTIPREYVTPTAASVFKIAGYASVPFLWLGA